MLTARRPFRGLGQIVNDDIAIPPAQTPSWAATIVEATAAGVPRIQHEDRRIAAFSTLLFGAGSIVTLTLLAYRQEKWVLGIGIAGAVTASIIAAVRASAG
ncbi:MAG: hypothetical protein JSV86_05915 [Gemmatimonadota bacterium]|nr:MAG: hypothetical protein JSV86_05915 [Gemmatimonadota bacterium]